MLQLLRLAGLFLLGLLLPFEYVKMFSIGNVVVTPSKLVGLIFLGVGLIQWTLGRRRLPASTKNAWVVVFAFALGVANVVTISKGIPARELLPYTMTNASVILLYFLVGLCVTSLREVKWLLAALVLGNVFVSLTALGGYGYVTEAEQGVRAGGLGGNVNELAFNLLAALPIAFGFAIATRSWIWRLGAFSALGVFLWTVTVSLSRSAYLSALVMWAFGMLRFRRFDLLKFAVPAVLVFALGLALLPSAVTDRLATLDTKEARRSDGSVQSRVVSNLNGLEAFARNPLIGVGMRNFMNWEAREIRGAREHSVIHNVYLTTAAEVGLVGLIPLLAIIFLTWREYGTAWRGAERAAFAQDQALREFRVLGLLLQVSFLGTLIGGLFHPSLEYKVFWLLMGLSPPFLALVRARVSLVMQSTGEPQAAPGEPFEYGWNGAPLSSEHSPR